MAAPGLSELATTTLRNRKMGLAVKKLKIKATLKPTKGKSDGLGQAAMGALKKKVERSGTGYRAVKKER